MNRVHSTTSNSNPRTATALFGAPYHLVADHWPAAKRHAHLEGPGFLSAVRYKVRCTLVDQLEAAGQQVPSDFDAYVSELAKLACQIYRHRQYAHALEVQAWGRSTHATVNSDGEVLVWDDIADCYTRHHDLTETQIAHVRLWLAPAGPGV